MNEAFRIYQQDQKQMIERLVYPRFSGEITFSGTASDIENIVMDEDYLNASDIATALREAGEYILSQSKG
jgi:hypothetical protein